MISSILGTSFIEHLQALRGVLIRSFAAWFIATCLGLYYASDLLTWLIRPLGRVVFTAPCEAFGAYFSAAAFLGIAAAFPYVAYQVWGFVSPGLISKEKRFILALALSSFGLFAGGCVFGYFVVLPQALRFFLSFASRQIMPMITIGRYLSFIMSFTLSFGLSFQLPLVLMAANRRGWLDGRMLRKRWREAVVVVFILAAVLTPGTDVASQVFMAGPLLVLYGISLLLCNHDSVRTLP